MTAKADIGLIGLAVMGQNLVLNMERNGYTVAIYNRTTRVTDEFVAAHPGALVVTYVNSTAAVKAMSDVCVTSSNAVAVVRSLPADRPVIFAPDRYLGDWVRRETGRDLILWPGSCELHEAFTAEQVAALKAAHPQAKVLVHPECPQPVRALADVVGSTKRLLEAVQAGAPDAQWIVVTEPGIIHQMRRSAPRATFIETPATPRPDRPWGGCVSCNTCPHMRRNTLAKLAACLRNRSPELRLDPDLLVKARRPIERMIAIG